MNLYISIGQARDLTQEYSHMSRAISECPGSSATLLTKFLGEKE
uniref:Uncharacterized protein n=1 Tax=Anguilla anguilla TaxID=7936 RepID=A0A0E9T593_ANGAN